MTNRTESSADTSLETRVAELEVELQASEAHRVAAERKVEALTIRLQHRGGALELEWKRGSARGYAQVIRRYAELHRDADLFAAAYELERLDALQQPSGQNECGNPDCKVEHL